MQLQTTFPLNSDSYQVTATGLLKTAKRIVLFVTFNTGGLWSICNELDISSFVLKYAFSFLVATFTETVPDSTFSSHESFVSPGVKVSDRIHGRLSEVLSY